MGQGPHPDYTCGSIQRLDPHIGEPTTLYTACNGNKLSAPNDLVFDGHGGFYFTDLGKRYARHRDHGGSITPCRMARRLSSSRFRC
jgi:gluconolactonase